MPGEEKAGVAGAGTATAQASGDIAPFAGSALPGNDTPEDTLANGATAEPKPGAGTTETEVTEGAAAAEAEGAAAVVEAKTGDEATAADAAATTGTATPKKWAGEYESPEKLEEAHTQLQTRYGYSSAEGKRLATELKNQSTATEKLVNDMRAEITELKDTVAAGPNEKELSDEELEAMGNVKATRYLQRQQERKNLLANAKMSRETRKANEDKERAETETYVRDLSLGMPEMKDEKSGELLFPDYVDLIDDVMSIADYAPGIKGHKQTPVVAYWAAYGRRALKRDAQARERSRASQVAAIAKTKAAAVGAGTAGEAGGGAKQPGTAGKGTVDPNSDEAYNDRLVDGFKKSNRSFSIL